VRVSTAEEARAWLASWGGRPRPGILAAAVDGLELGASVLNGPARAKVLEALEVLRCA